MANWFAGNGEGQRPLLTLLLALRLPLLVLAIFFCFAFDIVLNGVAEDAARYVAMDRPYQLWLLALLATLAGTALRYCSELTLTVAAPSLRTTGVVVPILSSVLLRLIGAAPALLLALRFVSILDGEAASHFSLGEATLVWIAIGVYVFVGLVMAALPHAFFVVQRFDGYTQIDRLSALDRGSVAAGLLLLAAAIGVFFLFWDWRQVEAAQFVGPFGVLLLWAFAAVMYFTPVAIAAHVVRLPLLSLLALAAVVFSLLDLNDNHAFRTVAGTTYYEKRLSFADWLEERKDIDLAKYEHYPVFIVAAEGGGLRAAYFTARVLKTLQTICPAFALHTIAISGVSGGSVGATSFVQLEARERPPTSADTACDVAAPVPPAGLAGTDGDDLQAIYSADHLSPLIGATFFADALQRLLPVPVQPLDRARAIECSYERSIAAAVRDDPSLPCSDRSERFGALYEGVPGKPTLPYLFLNTTSVNFGGPVPVVARATPYPFVGATSLFDGGGERIDTSVQALVNGGPIEERAAPATSEPPAPGTTRRDLPLSTAAFASARFPFILPAARIAAHNRLDPLPLCPQTPEGFECPAFRFVDGGLYEDTGTWFAQALVRELRRQIAEADKLLQPPSPANVFRAPRSKAFVTALKNVRVHVLLIRATPCDHPSADDYFAAAFCLDYIPPGTREGLSEIGSPIRALLRARASHGSDAIHSLCDYARDFGRPAQSEISGRECAPFAGDGSERDGPVTVDEIHFTNTKKVNLPLTWTLSREARQQVDRAIADIPGYYWPGGAASATGIASNVGFRHVVCLLDARIGAAPVRDCQSRGASGTPPPPQAVEAPPPNVPVETPAPVVKPPPPAPVVPKPPLPELDQPERCESCKPQAAAGLARHLFTMKLSSM